ncbi:uncharacterized protein PHACADRAFT_259067 [Phanerochaete carnosa HHB-10118-sp]|uniref:Uncharacterized protein n=1 Tax=Phanerochaete carnosa (strain HHB-10118-sp) TaxID=650164 RepID=K5WWS1_PHACS|nr:uncharacterized protein PHACADRAFT_259067 [Phanerochaete carnosa HHB-10118-sp]EKM54902.1 hypothetical protein PHACADRAFT_259067 [Phanerochaete carnosa HHB-10118-sp]
MAISLLMICGIFYRYRRSGPYGDVQYLDSDELILDLGGPVRPTSLLTLRLVQL